MRVFRHKLSRMAVWGMVPLMVVGGLPRVGCVCADGQHKVICERLSQADAAGIRESADAGSESRNKRECCRNAGGEKRVRGVRDCCAGERLSHRALATGRCCRLDVDLPAFAAVLLRIPFALAEQL